MRYLKTSYSYKETIYRNIVCDKYDILITAVLFKKTTGEQAVQNILLCHIYFIPGGEHNLDQTGMCHRRLKFITLFWSGKTQKVYPVLEPRN